MSDPRSQHKQIGYVGEYKCRFDVNGPGLRYGLWRRDPGSAAGVDGWRRTDPWG